LVFIFGLLLFLNYFHYKQAWPGKPVCAIQRPAPLLSASLSRITMIRQLLDIMHQAVRLPLIIHLGFSAQVVEYRL